MDICDVFSPAWNKERKTHSFLSIFLLNFEKNPYSLFYSFTYMMMGFPHPQNLLLIDAIMSKYIHDVFIQVPVWVFFFFLL